MVLCEDSECSVCYLPYSRLDRIPRVLHCRHTFCALCLDTMSQPKGGLLTVRCPLCRRVTCVGLGRSLQEALWVNSRLWDQIPENTEGEEGEEVEEVEEEEAVKQGSTEANRVLSPHAQECLSARHPRTKIRFSAFFRKFSLTKEPQERIVPGCNVEMKSWRRLSAEAAF